jgi:phosphoglycolate phosphatase-like HAD superfamily hydrolase
MPICFDLDGTLGSFGGGYALLRQALGALWSSEPDREELLACRGSMDWEIVDELHRARYGRPLEPQHYLAYEEACLARFEAAFPAHPPAHTSFEGILQGLHLLRDEGLPVALVSGNTPKVLAFKAARLGVADAVPRHGSLPRLSRTGALARALEGCGGPHLYLGDRPHDLQAALAAGMPFLAVGEGVPGHPFLPLDAPAEVVVAAVKGAIRRPGLAFPAGLPNPG